MIFIDLTYRMGERHNTTTGQNGLAVPCKGFRATRRDEHECVNELVKDSCK